MAGHSKWANIKHQKAKEDAKRGKIFTKIIRDLMVAAKAGGGKVADNASLRLVVDVAKKANMPKDVMERAIKRGTGELAGDDYVEKVYEGHAQGGVAIMVKTLTDNGTRTFTNMRTAFNKNGGNLGESGAVGWMFKHCGVIVYPNSIGEEDVVMELAIESGADDFQTEGDFYKIITEVVDFGAVHKAMEAEYGEAEEADLTYIPTQMQPVTDFETAEKVMKVLEAIEGDDDVQDVISNMDIDDNILKLLA